MHGCYSVGMEYARAAVGEVGDELRCCSRCIARPLIKLDVEGKLLPLSVSKTQRKRIKNSKKDHHVCNTSAALLHTYVSTSDRYASFYKLSMI